LYVSEDPKYLGNTYIDPELIDILNGINESSDDSDSSDEEDDQPGRKQTVL